MAYTTYKNDDLGPWGMVYCCFTHINDLSLSSSFLTLEIHGESMVNHPQLSPTWLWYGAM